MRADFSHPSVHMTGLFRRSLASVSSENHWFSLFPRKLLREEEASCDAAGHSCLPQPSFPPAYFSRHRRQIPPKHLARGAAAFWGGLSLAVQHRSLSPAASPHQSAGIPPVPPSAQPPLGVLAAERGALGVPAVGRKERKSTVLLQLPRRVQQWAGCQRWLEQEESLGDTASVSPPVVLVSQPFARLVLPVRPPAGVLPTVAASAAAGRQVHRVARAVSGPWGTGV